MSKQGERDRSHGECYFLIPGRQGDHIPMHTIGKEQDCNKSEHDVLCMREYTKRVCYFLQVQL